MHGLNNVEYYYMLQNTYCWRLTRTAFILTVTSQGKPNSWMLMRSNRSVPLKNTLNCIAIVSCVCKKFLSFHRATCSSEFSTQFKLGLLLTEKLNNGNHLKTLDVAIEHNVLDKNYVSPARLPWQKRKLPTPSSSQLFSSFEDSK